MKTLSHLFLALFSFNAAAAGAALDLACINDSLSGHGPTALASLFREEALREGSPLRASLAPLRGHGALVLEIDAEDPWLLGTGKLSPHLVQTYLIPVRVAYKSSTWPVAFYRGEVRFDLDGGFVSACIEKRVEVTIGR